MIPLRLNILITVKLYILDMPYISIMNLQKHTNMHTHNIMIYDKKTGIIDLQDEGQTSSDFYSKYYP